MNRNVIDWPVVPSAQEKSSLRELLVGVPQVEHSVVPQPQLRLSRGPRSIGLQRASTGTGERRPIGSERSGDRRSRANGGAAGIVELRNDRKISRCLPYSEASPGGLRPKERSQPPDNPNAVRKKDGRDIGWNRVSQVPRV